MCNWKHLACVYPNQGIVLTGSYANASKLDTSDSGGGGNQPWRGISSPAN